MTEKKAESQGLEFENYSSDHERMKAYAKELRAKGRRAVLVYVPGSRREGWSVYAEPEKD